MEYLFGMESTALLRASPMNQDKRTTPDALRDLKEDIKGRGVVVPLIVSDTGEVIDGHRRLACAQQLGIKIVPVMRVPPDVDASELYCALNETSRKLSSREWLCRYQYGGGVPRRLRARLGRLREIGGDALLNRIAAEGLSPTSILNIAHQIAHHVGKPASDTTFLRDAIAWVIDGRRQWPARIDGRRQWQARIAIKYAVRMPITALLDAIREKRDLVMMWV